MNPILQQLLPSIITLVVLPLISWATVQAVTELRKHTKLKQLAFVAELAGDALEAAVKANGGQTNAVAIKSAEMAAKNVIVAGLPSLAGAMGAELDVLITHNVAAAAGQPVITPGGAVAVMPSPAKG